ncbi:non-ribosomal peptide synthetase, partial [Paenibacillus sp. UNC217MF]|uniref:non-ribosomal peptide synthetase n=1 Tax=Paenibacillus sp. UNC217MF TaxID=1449062 RepID=UPI0005679A2E
MSISKANPQLQQNENVYYELTEAQRRIWYMELLNPHTTVATLNSLLTIKGTIQEDKIVEVLQSLALRHDALRMRLQQREGEEPLSYIVPFTPIDLDIVNLCDSEPEAWKEEVEFLSCQPFPLFDSPLFKFMLFRTGESEARLFLSIHHIIADGYSLNLLGNEFVKGYHALLSNRELPQEVAPACTNLLGNEEEYLQSTRFQKDKAFWEDEFRTLPSITRLGTAENAVQTAGSLANYAHYEIPISECNDIRTFCESQRVSPFNLFVSALCLYMSRICGEDEVVLGTMYANRTSREQKSMVAMLVSTTPFRMRIDASWSFEEFLEQVKNKQSELIRHQKYPFNRIVPDLRNRFGFTEALLPVFFNYHPMEWGTLPDDAPFQYETLPLGNGHQDNELTVHIREHVGTGEMAIQIDYLTDLFARQDIDCLFQRLLHVIREAMSNPLQSVGRLHILPPEEQKNILHTYSLGQRTEQRLDRSMHELFETHAANTPDQIAVAEPGGLSLTYGQLNEQANRLARTLRSLGIGSGEPVAILGERSPLIVTAVLAVLKAGGAFVPLDNSLPADRLAYMVTDSEAKVLLTADDYMMTVPDGCRVVDLRLASSYDDDPTNLLHGCSPERLAYVIYTSGTTGRPKGVMIEHRSWVSTAWSWHHEYKLGDMEVRLLQMASFSFDVFAGDLARAWLSGGQLVICSNETRLSMPRLHGIIVEQGITLLESTPALLVPLMDYIYENGLSTGHLRLLIMGSDRFAVKDYQRVYDRFGSIMRILNSYGVTEACIDASYYEEMNGSILPQEGSVPIGRPLPHANLYVLGQGGTLQPVGVPGELCIGGAGVARGYLNRPELTAERFAQDPFVTDGRMYRTGDRAYWLPDGNLQFLGRLDDQLSIRGYRVEPGEIESCMIQIASIREAVVAVMPDRQSQQVLCAYYTGERELETDELRGFLASMLPDYMIPVAFMKLDQLPLTTNGKVDRRALPALDERISSKPYLLPVTDVEQRMAKLWQEVLDHEQIGLLDNFFELGGHSLKAMTLLTRIHEEFKIELGLRDIFQASVLKDLTEVVGSAAKRNYESLESAPEQLYYPLSSAQKRLFMLQQLDVTGLSYNMPAAFLMEGTLDKERLEAAFHSLFARHDALRTSFAIVDGEPIQRVQQQVDFFIAEEEAEDGEADAHIRAFIQPFDLGAAPLLRAKVVHLGNQRHLLLFDMHHIISDGISVQILTKELAAAYAGEMMEPLKLQYKDYAVWQQAYSHTEDYAKEEAYWLSQFAEEVPVLRLPTDNPRPAVRSFKGGRVDAELDGELVTAVRELARKSNTTVYMVLLATYSAFLSRIAGQDEIVVGTPVAGRQLAGLSGMLGMFVNTLALRMYPEGEKTFAAYLREVEQTALSAFEHEKYPFEELVQRMVQERDLSRNPLFDAMLVLQHGENEELKLENVNLTPYPLDYTAAKFDLTLTVTEREDCFLLSWEYDSSLFAQHTIVRWSDCFQELLLQAVHFQDVKLGAYDLVTAQDKEHLLERFAGIEETYAPASSVLTLFERQAMLTPDLPAIIGEEGELSYRQLNEWAEQLGAELRRRGVGTDTIAAVMTHRSLEMAAGIIGVLKAGGAYLPIDPEFPADRIRFMLEDSRPQALLTFNKYKPLIAELRQDVSVLYFEDNPLQEEVPVKEQGCSISPKHSAYVIYTSGTTGRSKGVIIEHGSFANTIQWKKRHYQFGPSDRALMLNPFIFDSFVTHFFAPIVSGAAVVMLSDQNSKDAAAIREAIIHHQITHLQSPPSFYSAMLENMSREDWRSVRSAVVAGEAVGMPLIRRLKAMNPEMQLMNEYGPTENTVVTTAVELSEETAVSIGRPIPNTRVYIVNAQGRLSPFGVPGELCIAGLGLARGYANQPELTAAKFVSDPFVPGERMYRTGDWARWLPDGTLEYLGRIDHQVKIRGNRIELGDIEAHLLTLPGISEAVVTVINGSEGSASLCAYFVADRDYTAKELRQRLGFALPSYMIPSYFVPMLQMPLTVNGKLDRRALPHPEGSNLAESGSYSAPRSDAEQKMVELWQEVLDVRPIGVRDDFFERGGHSLKATVLVSRMQKELQADVTLRDLFQYSTVEALTEALASRSVKAIDTLEPAAPMNYYPLTSAQKRMYVLQQLEGVDVSYNMPAVLRMKGSLDPTRFESALQQIILRHDALRTSFTFIDNQPMQKVHEHVQATVVYRAAEEQQLDARIAEFVRPFDLEQAPLLRVEVLSAGEHLHYLLLDMHHIISDGVSISIFVEEFAKLYARHQLEPLRLQYKDYAVWQQQYAHSTAYQKNEDYWLQHLGGELPVLHIPTDYSRPMLRSFAGERVDFHLDKALSESVQRLALNEGATVYMVLLAAYSMFLSRLSSQNEIIIGSPVAGRPHADLSSMMGMFVNTLPLRTFPSGQKKFLHFIQEIKQTTMDALEHGDYPLEDLVDQIVKERDMGRNPLFDAVFVLQNTDSLPIVLPDLNVDTYSFADKTTKFDLTLQVNEHPDGYRCSMEFSTALFARETVERWCRYFTVMLHDVITAPDTLLAEARLINQEEQIEQLMTYSGLPVSPMPNVSITGRFAEVVRNYPERLAVVCGERHLTYEALQHQSGILAGKLLSEGLPLHAAVGILADRSIEFIVAVMGVLKAGGAYVPLDPEAPEDRHLYILDDCGAEFLLVAGNLRPPESYEGTVARLDAEWLLHEDTVVEEQSRTVGADDPAYIMYTSGTTGRPKGVLVTHGNVVNLVTGGGYVPFHDGHRFAQTGSVSFDAATFEMFGAILHGGQLYPVEKEVLLNASRLGQFIATNGITVMFLTTSLFHHLADSDGELFTGIQHLIMGGEVLLPKHVRAVQQACPSITIWNGYGPTENTTFSTVFTVSETDGMTSIPIGRPIGGTTAYVLGDGGQVLPVGVPGELHLGGAGVAKGYRNQPKLTREKFKPDPFNEGKTMYATGDLARWLPNGNLEYMGRIDQQVKIRGYRIEPGEIEARLLLNADIRQASVVIRKDKPGNEVLCAYYVSDSALDLSALRHEMSLALPAYMVPEHYIRLEELPLTKNGKLDRSALPVPDYETAAVAPYMAPRTRTEAQLAAIWEDVLQISQVGVSSNFFELGGHSLKAMTLASRIHQALHVQVSIRDIFRFATIEALAPLVERQSKDLFKGLQPAEPCDYYPLSSAQRRLFVLQQLEGAELSYNMPAALLFHGRVDFARLEQAFRELLARHEVLRTGFERVDGEPVQRIYAEVAFDLPYREAGDRRAEDLIREFIRPFDLSQAPLLRVQLTKLTDTQHLLLFDMHHIISDGTSMSILIEEVTRLYGSDRLEPVSLHYKDYAVWLAANRHSNTYVQQKEYWLQQLGGELPVLQLPADFARPSIQSFTGSQLDFAIDAELTASIKQLAQDTGTTLFMVLLA